MSQRIRYQKISEGVLLSRRHFTTGDGKSVQVELDTLMKTYRIVDSTDRTVLATGGDTINLAVLKIYAKKALTNLGVSFTMEDRKRENVEKVVV